MRSRSTFRFDWSGGVVSEERFQQYLTSIRIASAFMRSGNVAGQMLYADTADARSWDDYLMRLWSGETEQEAAPVADMTLEGLRRHGDPGGTVGFRELELWLSQGCAPKAALGWLPAYGLKLHHRRRPVRSQRFGCWAWLYDAAIGLITHRKVVGKIAFHTEYHSGWGRYYLIFNTYPRGEMLFGISEEGHFAGEGQAEKVAGFNWRRLAQSSKEPHALTLPLLRAAASFSPAFKRLPGT
jgi:hypothetical protein